MDNLCTNKNKGTIMKRENKVVRKNNLIEITGNRLELEPYLGQTLECEVFVTNSLGYLGEKRLITEIRIPETNYYVKHLWIKHYNLPINKVNHGYQKMTLKVVDYWDAITGDVKYGVKYAGKKLKKPAEAKMVIPQWKLDEIEAEELKAEIRNAKGIAEVAKTLKTSKTAKNAYRKLRIVKKG